MTRLSSTLINEVEADHAEQVVLLEFTTFDGTSTSKTRLTTAAFDVDATVDGTTQTFTGAGGFVDWSGTAEGGDRKDGVEVALSGVDQALISKLLNNFFKGQPAQIWVAWLDESTGTVIDSPLKVFRGLQNTRFEATEDWGEGGEAGQAELRTTLVSKRRTSENLSLNPTPTDHNRMLARAGLATGDLFFNVLPSIVGKEIFWGREAPDSATGTTGGGNDETLPDKFNHGGNPGA